MFGKKCPRCYRKINKSYDFCPFCGHNANKYSDKDYGLLGKNDLIDEDNPFVGLEGTFIDRIINKAMRQLPSMIKMMEKQMRDFSDNTDKQYKADAMSPGLRVQFFVNGKRVIPGDGQIKLRNKMPKPDVAKKMPKEKLEKFSKLPKAEPISRVRRLSGKIIYELEVPGVENVSDVLINQLEDSIEIKALSKDKYYNKILNINLPVLRYSLNKGNLILELGER